MSFFVATNNFEDKTDKFWISSELYQRFLKFSINGENKALDESMIPYIRSL